MLDMSGPGAKYTSFSKLHNIVISVSAVNKKDKYNYLKTVRMAGLKTAAYLGQTAKEHQPDEKEIFVYDSVIDAIKKYPNLPRIVYVYMLIAHRQVDNAVYAADTYEILPTIISPMEVMDGAIVGGLSASACARNTTYHHQRNPIIYELLRRHGKELCFLGVILTNEVVTPTDRERASFMVSQIAKIMGAQGAIIAEEGSGAPDTDLMLTCKRLENSGVKTVLITDEMSGQDGASQGFTDGTKEADAIVSTGNINAVVTLPPMARTIGSLEAVETLVGGFPGSLNEDGSITIELNMIMGADCELGYERLMTKLK
jgi:glycine reductase complex component B subunit alpha and beta